MCFFEIYIFFDQFTHFFIWWFTGVWCLYVAGLRFGCGRSKVCVWQAKGFSTLPRAAGLTCHMRRVSPATVCHARRVSPATRSGLKSCMFFQIGFCWKGLVFWLDVWLIAPFFPLGPHYIFPNLMFDQFVFVCCFFLFSLLTFQDLRIVFSICYWDSFFCVLILMLILHQKSFSTNATCCW